MALESRRSGRFVWKNSHILLFALLAILSPGRAKAMLHPLDGAGNFHSYVDVVNRWVDEDRLDVLVLVEVANADLNYKEEDGGYVGRIRLEVQLEGPGGEVITQKRHIRTAGLPVDEAASSTLFQVFGLILEDVQVRSGRLNCQVYDVNRRREGILNQAQKRNMRSECATAWYAEEGPRTAEGISLEDPLFLVHAPFAEWNPESVADEASGNEGWLHDYTHPSRRYGLEQDRLQIFQPVWPAAGGVALDDQNTGLRVQVVSLDMEYAINDTITFDRRGRAALAAGRPAALFYELDVNLLPEGAYRMSLAPLGGQGRGSLVEFDVVWRLEALGRHRMDNFWEGLNPDPESPVNETYLEFQYRLAYVKKFLGGFGQFGANDSRGEVFLLMGPADEVQLHHMPMNFRDQNDARIKVYNRFAPDREGTGAKGGSSEGTQGVDPYQDSGGIPMPFSRRAETQRQTQQYSPTQNFAFELWKYNDVSKTLFSNRYSRKGMGQRFLFVDRTGTGDYILESSNILQGEE
jgi:GWxTD domain-containing protein